jgi:hypothetical protein
MPFGSKRRLAITMKLLKKISALLRNIDRWTFCQHLYFNDDFFTIKYGIRRTMVKWPEIEHIEALLYDGLFGMLVIYRIGGVEVYVDEQMINWDSFFEFMTHRLENFDKNKCENFWGKAQDGKVVCWTNIVL